MFSKIRFYVLVTIAVTFAVLIVSNKTPIVAGQKDGLLEALNKIGFAPSAQTGKTVSYGTGDDGDLQLGVQWPVPRFLDSDDGTVLDLLTGLIWLKNANCFGIKNWNDALFACNNLADGDCALSDDSSSGDWRLPNIRELQSLIDYDRDYPPLPSGHPITNVRTSYYWSSTASFYRAWHVQMSSGGVGHDHQSAEFYVWPVRGGN